MSSPRGAPPSLPIDEVLPALLAALASRTAVVLQAAPGAGKTTRVPLALLGAPWLGGQRIVMLEPRRLAARAAARRMAASLGEQVGDTVGFRIRGETRVGPATRIEVVTEGVLTRMLHDDPTLDGVGIVIFDEFHERSVHADLGLALALQTQGVLRDSLRLLVMSATLDTSPIARLLGDAAGDAPVVCSVGRAFPVDIRFIARRDDQRIEGAVAAAVRSALDRDPGSILAFLPGAAEIHRTAALLDRAVLPRDVRVVPLYGDLSAEAQDAAIAPAPPGTRKVVLATSIAETSLTIEGVQVVVDSGVARVPRFSARTGMSRLETVRVSRAAATQRAGRAGRTAPGVAYRLWSEAEDAQLLARATPEILDADLTALALDLARAGVRDAAELRWLDPPPAAGLAHARELLRQLGVLDADGRITAHGASVASFGVHPRLAHMLLRGRALGAGATACVVAALVDERDVLRREGVRDADLAARVTLVARGEAAVAGAVVDHDALRRVRERVRVLRAQLAVGHDEAVDDDATGWLLGLAYPDRVGQRRPGDDDRYLLRNGYGAVLGEPGALSGSAFVVAADLDGRLPHARIWQGARLRRDDLLRALGEQVVTEDDVRWDAAAGVVVAMRRDLLGAIVLREAPLRDVSESAVRRAMLDAIRRDDGVALPFSVAVSRWRERVAFVRSLDDQWPDLGDEALRDELDEWLGPHLEGLRRRSQVERLDLLHILGARLTWEQRRDLDRLAPTHVVVPTGSRIAVDYGDPAAPSIAVRLQELFGLGETPRVGDGRVPLVLQLLSPAHRPVQVTRDLAGFWRSSYFAVRKDLRGRYPKHEWPEDPMAAAPTRRARRK